ncbi:polysaccharide biosynthesis tyrosine autokinase [Halomonas alimentaria]|uniref:Polysaccharide biosynthesis tyrosine autokinase n=1 Tax=Halomonas alimentaria TaxID=147248 RepID=A0A7X4W5N2_9GAMM|nr:polysaccharide biosynthesis tyrosine autokinase [Halomonas alimentaria]NAW34710.1 polysaccharide biosynthesis tyrosine autokinase [Halomonas alimentaria]
MTESSNTAPPRSAPADDEIDLGRLFGLLLDHKWLIIAITFVFALGGVTYALLATPVYQADALVQVEEKSGMANPLEDVRSMLGEQPSADTELGIIKSRMVLGQAVDQQRLDLVVTPQRLPVVGEFLVRRGMERPDFAENSVWAGETINIGDFQVTPDYVGQPFQLKVIDAQRYSVSLEGEDLGEGQVGTQASFLNGDVTLRVAEIQAGQGATFTLQRRSRLATIMGLRSRLSISPQGKDSGLLDLSLTDTDPGRANRVLDAITQIYLTQNVQRQAAEAEQSLAFLEEQAPQVREELTAAENSLNSYRSERDSVDLSLETQSILERIVDLEKQLNELEFTEAEVSRRFTPSHPTYSALLEKKAQLRQQRDRLEEQVDSLPETQQQVLRMRRDVEVNQQVYVQLLNKIQEMQIARASTVGNVRIIDDAVAQPNPIEPKKPLIVVLATLLGGMLAVGLVLVRGLLRRGVESPEQIEDAGLAVYATVPRSEEQQKLIRRVKHKKDKHAREVSTAVLAERAPADTAIEALRGLRTSLHFAMLEATDNRLVITGASPGIGKSFVSTNLAAVCAQSGQRVLVVDADMRKGHIHNAFGGRSHDGLSELLTGKLSLDEAIRKSRVEGLHYMARGEAPPNPSELLMHERFGEFLAEASERYDLVIIDTPPVLAVTDPSIVGRQCGTTLMVARFQRNPVKEIQIATRRLENAGVTVKGAILNAMERKASTAYGYGYYNYAYK